MSSVFISYNWSQSDYADKVETAISPIAQVKRDKNDIPIWGSLSAFMKSIRKEDFAVLLISDEYLKSVNCMYEVSQLFRDENWNEHTMYVVFDNAAKIYQTKNHIEYINYWAKHRDLLEQTIKELPSQSTIGYVEEIKQTYEVLNMIGDFLRLVRDANNPRPDTAIEKMKHRISPIMTSAEIPVSISSTGDSYFRRYEEFEREKARSYASTAIKNGFVHHAERIYSDIIKSKRLAFYRNGVPLMPLLFLYQQVVVYIPPCSKDEIFTRFSVSWDTLLGLIDSGLVIPIIGHPEHYADQSYFRELFERNPASVWARGDTLGIEYAHGNDYWKDAHKLIFPEDYLQDTFIVDKYKRHFPGLSKDELVKRIDTEIKTNYVDLCIYGYEDVAKELLKEEYINTGFRTIFELSERLVYPSLMGLGGIPNYGLNKPHFSRIAKLKKIPDMIEHGPELSILTDGLLLTIPESFTPKIAVEFHKDDMAKKLWAALDSLQDTVASKEIFDSDIAKRAIDAKKIVEQALKEINSVLYQSKRAKAKKIADSLTRIVSLLPYFPVSFEEAISGSVEDMVTRMLKPKMSNFANQLWGLDDWAKAHQKL